MSDFVADATAMLKRNEGVRNRVYADSLGIPTIGVGFNLKRDDARTRLAEVEADLEAVMRGAALNIGQIDDLLASDIAECIADLRVLVPSFDRMPNEARLVLLDLRYNLGPTTLRTFHNTLRAFVDGDYGRAAQLLEGTLWARQVGPRAVRNVAILRRIADGA